MWPVPYKVLLKQIQGNRQRVFTVCRNFKLARRFGDKALALHAAHYGFNVIPIRFALQAQPECIEHHLLLGLGKRIFDFSIARLLRPLALTRLLT